MRWYEWMVIVASQVWMAACLAFIAYQTVILARMLGELTALVARTH